MRRIVAVRGTLSGHGPSQVRQIPVAVPQASRDTRRPQHGEVEILEPTCWNFRRSSVEQCGMTRQVLRCIPPLLEELGKIPPHLVGDRLLLIELADVHHRQNLAMINIEDLTIGQARALAEQLRNMNTVLDHPFRIGGNYFIRTVTHHHTGKLVQVTSQELILENAAWIADDGRLTDALKTGNFSEVEMFPVGSRVIIGRSGLIDAVEVTTIPTSQK